MANNDQIEAAQRHTYTIRYVDGICFSTDPNSVEAYHGLEWIEVSLLAAKFRNQDQQRFRISVFEKAKWSFHTTALTKNMFKSRSESVMMRRGWNVFLSILEDNSPKRKERI